MASTKDPLRCVGPAVHAKATAVTSASECSRLYGSFAKHKFVNGKVLEVIVDRSNGRASTSLRIEWILSTTPTPLKTTKTIKIVNIKPDTVPVPQETRTASLNRQQEDISTLNNQSYPTVSRDVRELVAAGTWDQLGEGAAGRCQGSTQRPDAIAHEIAWYTGKVYAPIGGHAPRKFWSHRSAGGETIREGGGIGTRTPFDCFMAIFPFEHLLAIRDLTHELLLELGRQGTTVSEILRFFGILILMTRFEFGEKGDLWKTESTCKYIPAPCFGKTGMSRDLSNDLLRCIRFSKKPETQGQLSSVKWRWALVDDFLNAINKHRETYFTPSDLLCVDESISRWYGKGGHWIDVGLPHYVAIDRKPENGCELQDASCGRSGIIIRLEIVTTAEEEAEKEFEGKGMHGAAVLRRLVHPWSGSHRTVCADSYFASVYTADMFLKMDLKFIGVVKTAHRKYPLSYLSGKELSERGQFVSMVRKELDGCVEMMAVMWLDRERRYFASTASSTEDGTPYVRKRWRQLETGAQRVELTVPQPKVCETYCTACSQIDRHNRCRQDDLKLEKKLETHDWSFRVNTSLLVMIIVDSWLLYSGAEGSRSHMTQRNFYERLATELIDNTFERLFLRNSVCFSHNSNEAASSSRLSNGIGIHLTPTRQRRKSKDGKITQFAMQRKCRVCKIMKTTHICSACFSVDSRAVWLCRGSQGRRCFAEHLNAVHNVDDCV